MQKIERWIEGHALIANNAVYLRKSDFNPEFTQAFSLAFGDHVVVMAPLLNDYVEQHHQGNMTAFAESKGTRQQQVYRWMKRAVCLYAFGEIYRQQKILMPVSF